MLAVGCGSGSSSCSDSRTCGTGGSAGSAGSGAGGTAGTSGSGGVDGGAGTGGTSGTGGTAGTGGNGGSDASTCDPSKTPGTEACLVADKYAVFVDGTVATTGDGSQASPFKTIGEAISAAGGKLILVCDTTYDEQVKLTAGVRMYGGFKCTDWTYEGGQRAVVAPSTQGYALEVDSVTDPVVIEDLEFDAQDGTAKGDSSVAAFVHGSTDVALHRDKLVAGKGVDGAAGVLNKFTYPTQLALTGNDANKLAGGALKQCAACPAGDQSVGGHGGSAAPTGEDGGAGSPALGGGQGGKAGVSCQSGGAGNPAPAETAAAGATSSGTLDASGWTPSNGSGGKAGGAGQGGGGGASDASGGGGGGGCGGCGGAGGPGGGGGGASVALMVFDSTVSVDAGSELVTANAGAGGKGAAGQAGQSPAGVRGLPAATGGCPGGNGGAGGDGAAGGGGAGGLSVAVLWKGAAAPTVDPSAKLTLGAKGAKGVGGDAGKNDGVDGVAQNMLQVP